MRRKLLNRHPPIHHHCEALAAGFGGAAFRRQGNHRECLSHVLPFLMFRGRARIDPANSGDIILNGMCAVMDTPTWRRDNYIQTRVCSTRRTPATLVKSKPTPKFKQTSTLSAGVGTFALVLQASLNAGGATALTAGADADAPPLTLVICTANGPQLVTLPIERNQLPVFEPIWSCTVCAADGCGGLDDQLRSNAPTLPR